MEYVAHKSVWFPSAIRLGGYRLQAPRLGQIRLLEAVNSPYLLGGPIEPEDTALALHILATPWRRCRRQIAALWPIALAVRWKLRRQALRDPALPAAINALVDAALWSPDPYVQPGAASRLPCASGMAARLACRAVRLQLDRLAHDKAWRCVWDIPVAAIMAYGVADAELDHHEFQTRAETEQFAQPHPGAIP